MINEATLTDDEGNVFEKNDAALRKYFAIFNEKYFDGKLAPIPMYWTRGECVHGKFDSTPLIKERKYKPNKIIMNINANGTFAAFRNTLVHEMLHYYVRIYIGLPEKNWEMAESAIRFNDRRRLNIALRRGSDNAHGFEWGELAAEMSKKYPELYTLQQYATFNAETGVAAMDKDYVLKWTTNNAVLKQISPQGIRYFVIKLKCEAFEKFMQTIESGKTSQSDMVGTWYREFIWPDPMKFEQIKTGDNFRRYIPDSRFPKQMIRKEKELGTLSLDAGNVSKSGLSQEEINRWCNTHEIYRKVSGESRRIYVVRSGSKVCQAIENMIKSGKTNNILLAGTWDQLIPSRDKTKFMLLHASEQLKSCYSESSIESMISIVDRLGKVLYENDYQ